MTVYDAEIGGQPAFIHRGSCDNCGTEQVAIITINRGFDICLSCAREIVEALQKSEGK